MVDENLPNDRLAEADTRIQDDRAETAEWRDSGQRTTDMA
jgi:hypothetical protein